MIKVITYGTYDLLHYGHIRLLERAKALGDYLIVGVTSEAYDKSRGKINNQQSLMERIAAVKATGLADEIIVEEYEGQKIDDIRRYGVDIFAIGSDWEGEFDYLNEFCKVIYLPRTEGISSSGIRAEKRKLVIGIIGVGPLCDNKKKKRSDDVKRALDAGKHVICEAPIATSKAQCEELFSLAGEKGLILTDGIKTAYSTAYSRLMVVAKSGRIGDIISVDATCSSLQSGAGQEGVDLKQIQNSICAWGPTAMLPVFQLLGTNYKSKSIITKLIDKDINFDGFTKVDFVFDKAVASIKVAKAAKSEGELIITGTKGYIYVPAPWWKTEYFEVRFENQSDNRRYFYQLDGEGIRYEIVAFAKAVESGKGNFFISEDTSKAIANVIESFNNKEYTEI